MGHLGIHCRDEFFVGLTGEQGVGSWRNRHMEDRSKAGEGCLPDCRGVGWFENFTGDSDRHESWLGLERSFCFRRS